VRCFRGSLNCPISPSHRQPSGRVSSDAGEIRSMVRSCSCRIIGGLVSLGFTKCSTGSASTHIAYIDQS
jgi:hypothetical protein